MSNENGRLPHTDPSGFQGVYTRIQQHVYQPNRASSLPQASEPFQGSLVGNKNDGSPREASRVFDLPPTLSRCTRKTHLPSISVSAEDVFLHPLAIPLQAASNFVSPVSDLGLHLPSEDRRSPEGSKNSQNARAGKPWHSRGPSGEDRNGAEEVPRPVSDDRRSRNLPLGTVHDGNLSGPSTRHERSFSNESTSSVTAMLDSRENHRRNVSSASNGIGSENLDSRRNSAGNLLARTTHDPPTAADHGITDREQGNPVIRPRSIISNSSNSYALVPPPSYADAYKDRPFLQTQASPRQRGVNLEEDGHGSQQGCCCQRDACCFGAGWTGYGGCTDPGCFAMGDCCASCCSCCCEGCAALCGMLGT